MSNEAGFFQNAHRHRDAGTPDAQHLRQKLLRQIEPVASNAVLRHEQPPRATLLDNVQPVTGSRLRHRFKDELAVTMEQFVERLAFYGELGKICRGNASRLTRDLSDRLEARRRNPMKHGDSGEAIASDRHRFDRIAVFHLGHQ